MKKFYILLINLLIWSCPVFSENWIQLENGYFVDTDSQLEYYLPNKSNIYSVWTKSYNDGSNNFYKQEAYFNNLMIVDCDNAQFTIKNSKTYFKNGKVNPKSIVNLTNESLKWANVSPYTKGELLYNYVCQPRIKTKTQNVQIENNSASNSIVNSTIDLYKNNVNSMVYIETQDSSGSGVIVKPDGTFITCFHVIANADYITVKLNDGSIYNVNGFRYINPLDDIAILTLDTTRQFKPIELNSSNNIDIGEKVYTISNPQGMQFTFSDGMISQYTKDYIQFTAPVSPGSSGGALLDKNGQLLGMITSLLQESQNINFALPNEYYQSKINNQIIKNTKNLKWTDFLVDNAETNQFHLYTNYALNELNFEMLYKYIRPFTKREDYPKEYYSMTGLFAFYAACATQNDNYLKEAIDWFKLSYKYYPNDELTLFTLPLLMAFNGDTGSDFSIQILYKLKNSYPNSYYKFVSLGNLALNCKDEKCTTELMSDMLDYITLLSNLRKY